MDPTSADNLLLNPLTTTQTTTTQRISTSDKTQQYIIAFIVSLGSFCINAIFSWGLTGSVLQESFIIYYVHIIGGLLSILPMGFVVDKFGRKLVLRSSSVMLIFSFLLICIKNNQVSLIIGRILLGFAISTNVIIGPIYLAEIADPSIRGRLIVIYQLFAILGQLLNDYMENSFSAYGVLVLKNVIPAVLSLCLFLVPESPLFLIQQGRIDEAQKILETLRGKDYDVNAEIMETKENLDEFNRRITSHGIKAFFTRSIMKPLLTAMRLLFFQQICRTLLFELTINIAIRIFVSLESKTVYVITSVVLLSISVFATVVLAFLIEKARRKLYLMISSTGIIFCTLVLEIYLLCERSNVETNFTNFAAIASTVLFIVFFSIGYDSIVWVVYGELIAPKMRGLAAGVAYIPICGTPTVVRFVFYTLVEWLGYEDNRYEDLYLCIFTVIVSGYMVIATISTHNRVPETRGKTLLQIQEDLYRNRYH